MRLAIVLSIFLALLMVLAIPASAAVPSGDPQAATVLDGQKLPGDNSGRLPLGAPWPLLLSVGYISMSLKKQLRRRGYPTAIRSDTFADLITLRRRPADSSARPPGCKSSSSNA
ncbi:MAG: hypothetical protein GWP05_09700 [Anaerolineaceae bacterium]|nr:hypothetical protein [Anaerolineaceae bacterium]